MTNDKTNGQDDFDFTSAGVELLISGMSGEDVAAVLEALTTGPRMARFTVAPEFCTPDEVLHLLVVAAHEAYLTGLAHGQGIDRSQADAANMDEYIAMTFNCVEAVNEYQTENPSGWVA